MTNIANKSPEQLAAIISEAQAQLEALQREKKKDVLAKIKELAASINVNAVITEPKSSNKKSTATVPAKFANPSDSSEFWTGRGIAPKWMQALIEKGHKKEEFLIKH